MSNRTTRGLGKGLRAIIADIPNDEQFRTPVGYVNKLVVEPAQVYAPTADIIRVPAGLIEANPFQPRKTFDKEALEDLSDSIRTLGLIHPITVRKVAGSDKYQIISGERRYRACILAGLENIPAYVREADDQGMLEMAIVENIQREDLDPIEVAMSYEQLIEECKLTQEQMALRVGKKRASITNYLRLLKLPPDIQHDIKVGLLSVGHAKALLSLDSEQLQKKFGNLAVKQSLSVRQLEDKVRKFNSQSSIKEEGQSDVEVEDLPEHYYKVLEYMGRVFGDDISLKRNSSGKGSITLRFNSDEQMMELLSLLEKQN